MKQMLVVSFFVIVAFIQLINAETNGFDSEDISSISSAELVNGLERLRNERVQNELESAAEQIPNENEAIKQKRGRRNFNEISSLSSHIINFFF